jgi:hypothetical protein
LSKKETSHSKIIMSAKTAPEIVKDFIEQLVDLISTIDDEITTLWSNDKDAPEKLFDLVEIASECLDKASALRDEITTDANGTEPGPSGETSESLPKN